MPANQATKRYLSILALSNGGLTVVYVALGVLALMLFGVYSIGWEVQDDAKIAVPQAANYTNPAFMIDRLHDDRHSSRLSLPEQNTGQKSLGPEPLRYEPVGCLALTDDTKFPHMLKDARMDVPMCANHCGDLSYSLFDVGFGDQCFCGELPSDKPLHDNALVEDAECSTACRGNKTMTCGARYRFNRYHIVSRLRETIVFYAEPAKNRGSLFLSSRFMKWASGRYTYRLVVLNHKLTTSSDAYWREMCDIVPGRKVFIGHGELLLRHWPGNTVMVITGDEAGDWGLVRNGKYYGLHGPDSLLPSNESHPLRHILMPEYVTPWFRQYYDSRQIQAFGTKAIYVPLGPRFEFPDLSDVTLKLSSQRKYIYMFVASGTDPSRVKLNNQLAEDTTFSRDQVYIHFAQDWHPNANHPAYLRPEDYARVMQDSVFALCPKGHSIDQFRLYEAMESGAIPVLENKDGYLVDKLPPEYLDSPMVIVDSWSDVTGVLHELMQDSAQIDKRQKQMQEWYTSFMLKSMALIEDAVTARLGARDELGKDNCEKRPE
eukprot:m.36740 g.36740  ORF g.36740 m.36740 type:complete len:545 (+) comp10032_c0_seq4:90-1724(+)